jgi:hypothetical protein
MQKFLLIALAAVSVAPAAFAQSDLELPGERWLTKFTKYVCDANGVSVSAPLAFSKYRVEFSGISTDRSLDNGLIKANFQDNGLDCAYSAFLLADNKAATIKLVESRAHAAGVEAGCEAGKAMLDAALADNVYLYYGHPHNLAIMVPVEGASDVCGPEATHVGVNFVVSGKKQP